MTILSQEEKSLPQKISDDIIALILEENLKPGDRLPNETILSQRLDVGRSSLREAMKLLASRNIVTVRQGSGTYIAASPGMVEDPLGFIFIDNKQKLVQDLLEVRFLLEPSIAAMAATRADEKDIKKITALCDEVETLLKNHEDHTQKDIDFHTAIALSSKNVVVPRLIPVINSSIPLFVETTGGILRRETIESHREIADAMLYLPGGEAMLFLTDVDHATFENANETRQNNLQSATVSLQVVIDLCKRKETAALEIKAAVS